MVLFCADLRGINAAARKVLRAFRRTHAMRGLPH
jgi:hypothetical protein